LNIRLPCYSVQYRYTFKKKCLNHQKPQDVYLGHRNYGPLKLLGPDSKALSAQVLHAIGAVEAGKK
jgi:hypothetical protein